MARDALIGSGLVGSILAEQKRFDSIITRQSRFSYRGERFRDVYCAAMPGLKWYANQNAVQDATNLIQLIDFLGTIRANRFILISTVDVFGCPCKVDESFWPWPTIPYGMHRRILEQFVQERFSSSLIVRLSGIVTEKAKKGPLYALKFNCNCDKLNADSYYQWYPSRFLSEDIDRALSNREPIIHLTTPPVSIGELCVRYNLPKVKENSSEIPVRYDVRTLMDQSGYIRPIPFHDLDKYFNK